VARVNRQGLMALAGSWGLRVFFLSMMRRVDCPLTWKTADSFPQAQ
jgi:hypothetical protein